MKVIRYQAPQIKDVLLELLETSDDAKTKSEDESLAKELENFEFLLGIIIWHEILFGINMVRKILQSKDMHINVVIEQLKGLISYFENYRENEFTFTMVIATSVALEIEIESVFFQKNNKFKERNNLIRMHMKIIRNLLKILLEITILLL